MPRPGASAMSPGFTCLTLTPTRTTLPSCRRECGCSPATADCRGWFTGRATRVLKARALSKAIDNACADPSCLFVNRNRGSGTRILIDGLLRGRRPAGYAVEVRSHNAVAAAVAQGRADWGLAIEPVARLYHLGFTPSRHEQYDFAIPADRWDRPAVAAFRALVNEAETRGRLAELGFHAGQGERRR